MRSKLNFDLIWGILWGVMTIISILVWVFANPDYWAMVIISGAMTLCCFAEYLDQKNNNNGKQNNIDSY